MNTIKNNSKTDGQAPAELPFYSWQCITLQLEKRYIDLVIKKDEDMVKFIKLLVYKTDTMDGNRGSALRLCARISNSKIIETEEEEQENIMDDERKEEIREEIKTYIYKKTVKKYRVLSVRSKISYHAFIKKMTIVEFLLNQILKTYYHAYESKIQYPNSLIDSFGILISGDLHSIFKKLVQFELEYKKF